MHKVSRKLVSDVFNLMGKTFFSTTQFAVMAGTGLLNDHQRSLSESKNNLL